MSHLPNKDNITGPTTGQSFDAAVELRTLGKDIVSRPTSKLKAHLALWLT
jgi:hypothetical protein